MATLFGFNAVAGISGLENMSKYFEFYNPEQVQVSSLEALLKNPNKENAMDLVLKYQFQYQNACSKKLDEVKQLAGHHLNQMCQKATETGSQYTKNLWSECFHYYNEKMAMLATPTLPRMVDGSFGIRTGVLGSTILTPTDQTPSPSGQSPGWPNVMPSFQPTFNSFPSGPLYTNNYAVPMTPNLLFGNVPNPLLTLMPQNYHYTPVLQQLHTSKAANVKNVIERQPYKRKTSVKKTFAFDKRKMKLEKIPIGIKELSTNGMAIKALVKCFNSFRTYHNLPIKYMSSVTGIPQTELNPFFHAFQSGKEDWHRVNPHFNKVATWIYLCHQYEEEVPGLENAGYGLDLKFNQKLETKHSLKKKRELESDLEYLENFIRQLEKRETSQPYASEILALARRLQGI
ncbi:hypothetical protein CAEBREN_14018 [Caenorhabditis brenneri]|uniref:Uncharacterized protein n=1 Tax=Caenorhabditis brenneri TaxID=135651 RepID=G0M6N0_CAEBE|nr:hypothetical protein CAEBREN_14018 [Caenorhabditis brenneri]